MKLYFPRSSWNATIAALEAAQFLFETGGRRRLSLCRRGMRAGEDKRLEACRRRRRAGGLLPGVQ